MMRRRRRRRCVDCGLERALDDLGLCQTCRAVLERGLERLGELLGHDLVARVRHDVDAALDAAPRRKLDS